MGRVRDDEKRRLRRIETIREARLLARATLASEESILDRIHTVTRRCELLRREMWRTGNLSVEWRALADELERLEAETEILYAELRAARAGRAPV